MLSASTVRTLTALGLLTAAALLAGCGSPSGAGGASASAGASGIPSPTATPTISSGPTAEPLVTTCDNTVAPDALASFQAEGYTGQPRGDAWLIAGTPITGGIECQWMIDHSVGTDNFILLAWGPLDTEQADTAIAALLAEGGWRREDASEGVYLTADGADMLPTTDAQGYGATYLFADGQVKYAGTKAELAIIAAPEGFVP